jgi:hypothetical protein
MGRRRSAFRTGGRVTARHFQFLKFEFTPLAWVSSVCSQFSFFLSFFFYVMNMQILITSNIFINYSNFKFWTTYLPIALKVLSTLVALRPLRRWTSFELVWIQLQGLKGKPMTQVHYHEMGLVHIRSFSLHTYSEACCDQIK